MKHDDVLTLRWSESKWPTPVKEQIKKYLAAIRGMQIKRL